MVLDPDHDQSYQGVQQKKDKLNGLESPGNVNAPTPIA